MHMGIRYLHLSIFSLISLFFSFQIFVLLYLFYVLLQQDIRVIIM